MVFLSLGLRAVVNVEALNMVESVGNIVRHRKAAVVYRRGSDYVVRWVPAVSGESIAHSYQWWISVLAAQRGLPLCEYCERGEFVKHADRNVFGSKHWEQRLTSEVEAFEKGKAKGEQALNFMHSFEKTVVENCVVEDVGGFLYAGPTPVKRTSRFATSYMVPALDAVEKAVVESQFQVRHAPTAMQRFEQSQMPYNVEVGSAVYALSFYIDLSSVGCTSMVRRECLPLDERRKRVEVAIDALALMIDSRIFGAKQTRFSPVVDYESVLVSLSDPIPFNVSPPASGLGFAEDSAKRAQAFADSTKSIVKLYAFTKDPEIAKALSSMNVRVHSTILGLFADVKKDALSLLR